MGYQVYPNFHAARFAAKQAAENQPAGEWSIYEDCSSDGWFVVVPAEIKYQNAARVVKRVYTTATVRPAQTHYVAKNGGSKPKEALDASTEPEKAPAQNKGSQNAADNRWPLPSPEELQAALERFLGAGHNNEPTLPESISNVIGESTRVGKFLHPDDWRIVAWAANAWGLIYATREFQDGLEKEAANQAASIWRG